MMKKFLLVMAIAAIAVLPGNVMGQNEASATASAGADILTGINLTKDANLHFGSMTVSATEAKVEVTAAADADREVTDGEGVVLLTQGTPHSAAHFKIENAEPSATYTITLPSVNVEINAGANTMNITGFTHSIAGTPTLDGSGDGDFYVGATLNIGENQPSGSYTGDFEVTVAYN